MLFRMYLCSCFFNYTTATRSENVGQVNHTGKVVIVTPNDRLKSVRNRSVIEPFGDVFVLLCLIENVLLTS